jgi:hypothetical protein
MRQPPKYIAGTYSQDTHPVTGKPYQRFKVIFASNTINTIQANADLFNLELRCRLVAIKKRGKRINPEYKVLREITNQTNLF